ncbi:MAG TPA: pyruvate kinase [Vicinamibacterales bacterium]|nr:pyruvate kinase [Vicinamibacterales bacterium]
MRRTRILVTLGPASTDPATIRALIDAGADAFRLNFSHGTIPEHQETVQRVRAAAAAAKRDIAVVQDLGGPKIRTGPLASPFALREGDTLIIEQGGFAGSPGRISCAFEALFTSVDSGQRLLIDDGRIELEVEAVAPQRLTTRVVTGGLLDAHKGINLPGVSVRTSALTPKDHEDLRAGVAMGVDFVALSFVQSADDVRAAHAAAANAGAPDLPIIAKIEKPHAVEHIDEIVRVSEGLMVARGDLGIELPFEKLPVAQKRIVAAGRRHGVPVILATQVLDSMRTEPRPTRAEVTDAAHAVDESVDAIMLAAETSVGKYPVKSVEALDLIIREAEGALDPSVRVVPDGLTGAEHSRALCEAAVTLAERARASAIVAVTEAGNTARLLASMRPTVRILAATAHSKTAARASLVWGVTPIVTSDAALPAIRDLLLARGLVPSGAAVVFIAMRQVLGRDGANYVQVERL